MATHAARRNLAGLARALVQHQRAVRTRRCDPEEGGRRARITFVEQLLQSKRGSAPQLARFAARAFGQPMLDLAAFDLDLIQKDLIDRKLAADRRVIALGKRGNRLSVAISDPTDLQALDRIKFQANSTIDPIMVEHDKLGQAIAGSSRTRAQRSSRSAKLDDLEIDLQDGTACGVDRGQLATSRTRRSSSSSRRC